jgi:hypothetical protein
MSYDIDGLEQVERDRELADALIRLDDLARAAERFDQSNYLSGPDIPYVRAAIRRQRDLCIATVRRMVEAAKANGEHP